MPLCLFYKRKCLISTRWQLEDGASLWMRSVSEGDPRQESDENLLCLEFRRYFPRQDVYDAGGCFYYSEMGVVRLDLPKIQLSYTSL